MERSKIASKLRIGLIGATPGVGWGPRGHIPAYQALPEIELAAVCTAHPETARAAAREFGVAEGYSDYQELVRSPNIDAVSVSTRAPLHYPITRAALEAGKHVYCEWPLAITAAQAAELLDLARRKNLRHIVGLQGRFAPPFLRMKELLDAGYAGRPLTFRLSMFLAGALQRRPAAYAFLAKKEAGASTLANIGGHALDILCWLLGDIQALAAQVDTQVQERITSDTGERIAVTAPDNVSLIARLRNGAVGTVQLSSSATAGTAFSLEVYGTAGKLAATFSTGMLGWAQARLTGAAAGERETEIPLLAEHQWVSGLPLESPAYNMAQLFRRFAAAIAEGSDLAPTFADALNLHRLLEHVERSWETRSWVEL